MSKPLEIDVNQDLINIMSKFNLKFEKMEDYYFSEDTFPGIAGQAFEMENDENGVVIQLDVYLLLPEQQFIESFVGHAPTQEEALASAFEQFEVNVLHVLLMAFWDKAEKIENGVGTDIWEINGHRWQAVIGNYGYRGDEPIENIIDDSDEMFSAIENQIKAMPLEEDIYAIRSVYTNVYGQEQVTEALINNEESPELEKAISSLSWKKIESYYSVRNLIILMKLQ